MSKWSEGYYNAAIIGKDKISLEELVEFSIASKVRSYTNTLAKMANNGSLSVRLKEITTPVSFTRFKGNDEEYWAGYNAALVDLNECDPKIVLDYQVKYFNFYKSELRRSVKGFINRAKSRVKNGSNTFEKETAAKALISLEAVSIELSGLTLEDLTSIK